MIRDIIDKLLKIDFEEDLNEEYINENIPGDLAKAYRNAQKANAGGSNDQSQTSWHNELGANNRRNIRWDYGHSTYEQLTKEEALEFLDLAHAKKKDIAEKLPQLRFLYNGELAEWENHGGNIYYLYWTNIPWERFRAIGFDGFKKGSNFTNDTKFAQKASDIEACIKCADKIYKTDEYEHPLFNNPDVTDERTKKGKYTVRGTYTSNPEEPGYDVHQPYDNYMLNKKYNWNNLDTGDHNIYHRYTSNGNNYTGKVANYYSPYIQALQRKKDLKVRLSNAKNAYKKFLAEREEFDEEEFETLNAKYKEKISNLESRYKEAVEEVFHLSKEYSTDIQGRIASFNNVIEEYLRNWQEASNACYNLYQELNKKQNEIIKSDPNLLDNVRLALKELNEYKEELEDLRINNSKISPENEEELIRLTNDLNTSYQDLQNWKEQAVKGHLSQLADIEDEFETWKAKLNDIRKRDAAAAAERASKNKRPELDQNLSNIVKFVDFEATNA